MQKKVTIISAENEFELAKKINNSQLDIFATTPIQKNDNSWICFAYYNVANDSFDCLGNKSGGESETLTSQKKFSKKYSPSASQLERWKKIKPTKKTIELLKKKGYTKEELKYIKTQFDAHNILENLKKGKIWNDRKKMWIL